MGSLIRMILIFAIVYYLIKKVGGFFYRTVAGSSDNSQTNSQQRHSRHQHREGEIRVEKAPNNKKSASDFKGGEYVDFEEVE